MDIKNTIFGKYKFDITSILIIINIIIYILIKIDYKLIFYLGFYPDRILSKLFLWQFFTYLFVHNPFNLLHLIFNMIGLFVFGRYLERKMGGKEFLTYYFVTGIGAILIFLFLGKPVIGASGAIFALLLAFATYFPDSKLLFLFVLPVKAPVVVLIFAALSLLFQFVDSAGNIAHLAHLTGLLVGYLYLVFRLKINPINVFKESFKKK